MARVLKFLLSLYMVVKYTTNHSTHQSKELTLDNEILAIK